MPHISESVRSLEFVDSNAYKIVIQNDFHISGTI